MELTVKDNTNLIRAVNILNRAVSLLNIGTREQLDKETLETISNYISGSLKYIPESEESLKVSKDELSSIFVNIDELINSDGFTMTNIEIKDRVAQSLSTYVRDFTFNVGKYLTNNKFVYSTGMSNVINDIIDTCLECGYYFEL